MTFKNLIILFFTISAFNLAGQHYALIDTTKPDLTDDVFARQCINFYNNNNLSSLEQIIAAWTSHSGRNEANQRALLLLSLNNNTFSAKSHPCLIENMLIYRAVDRGYFSNDTVFILPFRRIVSAPLLNEGYDHFTYRFANELKNTQPDGSEGFLLTKFYTGDYDTVFYLLQTDSYRGSEMHRQYQRYASNIIRDSFFVKFGIIAGMWIPQGKLSITGNHPTAGFQMGFRVFRTWGSNITMVSRFNNSVNPLLLNFGDTLSHSSNFKGGYYGIDLTKCLFYNVNNEIELGLGIAVDGFSSTHPHQNPLLLKETKVSSLNFNLGVSYRHIFSQMLYSEIQLKYEFINYDSKGGSNLSGNAISLNLILGIMSRSEERKDILKALHHKSIK